MNQAASPSLLWRHHLWLILLVGLGIVFSLGLACAVPLAAFAAAAAQLSSRRDAIMLVVAVWLVNQIIGFTVLGYPWTADTFVWGAVLGVVAVLATVAARWTAERLPGAGAIPVFVAAFLAAFVVYEGALFAVSATLLGGTEDFAPAIIGQIFAINAVAALGLYLVNRFGARLGFVAPVSAQVAAG